MRTRTRGIQVAADGNRSVDKQYRGQRIFERLGNVSQDEAEAWLRARKAAIDTQRENELRQGDEQLFRVAAGKYLLELQAAQDVSTLDTISGHILLLNQWVGDAIRLDKSATTASPASRPTGSPAGPGMAARRGRSSRRPSIARSKSPARS